MVPLAHEARNGQDDRECKVDGEKKIKILRFGRVNETENGQGGRDGGRCEGSQNPKQITKQKLFTARKTVVAKELAVLKDAKEYQK